MLYVVGLICTSVKMTICPFTGGCVADYFLAGSISFMGSLLVARQLVTLVTLRCKRLNTQDVTLLISELYRYLPLFLVIMLS